MQNAYGYVPYKYTQFFRQCKYLIKNLCKFLFFPLADAENLFEHAHGIRSRRAFYRQIGLCAGIELSFAADGDQQIRDSRRLDLLDVEQEIALVLAYLVHAHGVSGGTLP